MLINSEVYAEVILEQLWVILKLISLVTDDEWTWVKIHLLPVFAD